MGETLMVLSNYIAEIKIIIPSKSYRQHLRGRTIFKSGLSLFLQSCSF